MRKSDVLALVDEMPPRREVTFTSGRSVSLSEGDGEEIVVRGVAGQVELTVRFTEAGAVLIFDAAAISMRAAGTMALECGKLQVQSREGVEIATEGAIVERAEGDHRVEVEGSASTEARSVSVRARRGDLDLKANDDVVVVGERIRLN